MYIFNCELFFLKNVLRGENIAFVDNFFISLIFSPSNRACVKILLFHKISYLSAIRIVRSGRIGIGSFFESLCIKNEKKAKKSKKGCHFDSFSNNTGTSS